MTRVRDASEVASQCRLNGIHIELEQASLLYRFVGLLKKWNKVHNLISRQDTDNIWEKHIFHCLSPLKYFSIPSGARVIDIGTGGGLPGIPIAIVCKDTQVVLVDSIRKKMEAVREIAKELDLHNVEVMNGRVEDKAVQRRFAHQFDVSISRAVAPLADLLLWSAHLMRRDATIARKEAENTRRHSELQTPCLIALKGGELGQEIAQARSRFRNLRVEEIPIELEPRDANMDGKKIVIAYL